MCQTTSRRGTFKRRVGVLLSIVPALLLLGGLPRAARGFTPGFPSTTRAGVVIGSPARRSSGAVSPLAMSASAATPAAAQRRRRRRRVSSPPPSDDPFLSSSTIASAFDDAWDSELAQGTALDHDDQASTSASSASSTDPQKLAAGFLCAALSFATLAFFEIGNGAGGAVSGGVGSSGVASILDAMGHILQGHEDGHLHLLHHNLHHHGQLHHYYHHHHHLQQHAQRHQAHPFQLSDWLRFNGHQHHSALQHQQHRPAILAALADSAPVEFLRSAAGGAGAAYNSALEQHYAATTAAQAFILVALGDAFAQAIELDASSSISPSEEAAEAVAAYDFGRTARMGVLGLVIGGVGTSHWLQYLESQLPGHATAGRVLQKACIDAGFWAPIANTLYLILTPLSEGESVEAVKEKVAAKFVPVMQTELCTFFPYNLVSFSLIPPLLRPFTTGFVSMCFSVYISYVTHQDHTSPHKEEEEEDMDDGKAALFART